MRGTETETMAGQHELAAARQQARYERKLVFVDLYRTTGSLWIRDRQRLKAPLLVVERRHVSAGQCWRIRRPCRLKHQPLDRNQQSLYVLVDIHGDENRWQNGAWPARGGRPHWTGRRRGFS